MTMMTVDDDDTSIDVRPSSSSAVAAFLLYSTGDDRDIFNARLNLFIASMSKRTIFNLTNFDLNVQIQNDEKLIKPRRNGFSLKC